MSQQFAQGFIISCFLIIEILYIYICIYICDVYISFNLMIVIHIRFSPGFIIEVMNWNNKPDSWILTTIYTMRKVEENACVPSFWVYCCPFNNRSIQRPGFSWAVFSYKGFAAKPARTYGCGCCTKGDMGWWRVGRVGVSVGQFSLASSDLSSWERRLVSFWDSFLAGAKC